MEIEINKLELFMTTNDLLMRCLELLDQVPDLTSSERAEVEKMQMIAAQILDIEPLNKK